MLPNQIRVEPLTVRSRNNEGERDSNAAGDNSKLDYMIIFIICSIKRGNQSFGPVGTGRKRHSKLEQSQLMALCLRRTL